MARLITKFKYLKPDERNHFGGYAEYIATREGVEKIDESKRNAPATNKQKQLIKKILSDFPDSKSSLEYEDYLKEKTVGAASEFITRMLEVMSTALSRLNAFLDTELEQLLCFDTEIDAETFCNQKSAIFVIMPEENPSATRS